MMDKMFEHYEAISKQRNDELGEKKRNTENVLALFESHWDDILYEFKGQKGTHELIVGKMNSFYQYNIDVKTIRRELIKRGIFPKLYGYIIFSTIVFIVMMSAAAFVMTYIVGDAAGIMPKTGCYIFIVVAWAFCTWLAYEK